MVIVYCFPSKAGLAPILLASHRLSILIFSSLLRRNMPKIIAKEHGNARMHVLKCCIAVLCQHYDNLRRYQNFAVKISYSLQLIFHVIDNSCTSKKYIAFR